MSCRVLDARCVQLQLKDHWLHLVANRQWVTRGTVELPDGNTLIFRTFERNLEDVNTDRELLGLPPILESDWLEDA